MSYLLSLLEETIPIIIEEQNLIEIYDENVNLVIFSELNGYIYVT